jgi:amino acid transporter
VHFLTFLVAFTVMCSGITSASTASNAFAGFLSDGFGLGFEAGGTGILVLALGFMALVAAVNFRGVGESVTANVVLTCVELSGLLMIILIGFWAMSQGRADFSEVTVFRSSEEKSAFLALTAATSLAFFAMVGFEDSVNMAEECTNPVRDFPRMMLTGLGITGLIYVLVSICAVALVPVGDLVDTSKGSALTQVVRAGAPNLPFDRIFPFIGMFAVANSALINMLMASRLLYGLARQGVLPHVLGTVHPTRRTPWVSILFTTALAFGLIYFVVRNSQAQAISLLGGTTALLLLCVFTVVNISLIVLRRRPPVGHAHFKAPGPLPWIGAVTCAFLAGPWARSAAQLPQYRIAAWLLAIGIVLWAVTWGWNRLVRHRAGGLAHPEELAEHHGGAPTN